MIKFVHTNIITDDWKKLAHFYITVFGCKPIFPKRDLSGTWLNKATNIEDAHIQSIRLALPGYNDNLPTLEIFQYKTNINGAKPLLNQRGFGHIAFKVDNLTEVLGSLLKNGGTPIEEVVEFDIPGAGHITFVYTRDIDGNIIELQSWKS